MSPLPTPADEQRLTADVQRRLFSAKIRQGVLLVKLGLFSPALRIFEDAATLANSRQQTAETLQLRGNVRLQQGDRKGALRYLTSAVSLMEDDRHFQGRLYRDLALVRIAQIRVVKHGLVRKYNEEDATWLILKSQSLLNATGDRVELAATYSVHGYLYALTGSLGNARAYYAQADRILKLSDNREEELNNLIGMLTVATPQKRAGIRSRIWPLIWQTRQFHRVPKVVAITIMSLINDMKGEK